MLWGVCLCVSLLSLFLSSHCLILSTGFLLGKTMAKDCAIFALREGTLPLFLVWKSSGRESRAFGSHTHSCTQGYRTIGLAAPTEPWYLREVWLVQTKRRCLGQKKDRGLGRQTLFPPPLHSSAWWPQLNFCQWSESSGVCWCILSPRHCSLSCRQADYYVWNTIPAEIQVFTENQWLIFYTEPKC